MSRYIEGRDRSQAFLLPESIDDFIDEDNPVRAVEAFVDVLDLAQLVAILGVGPLIKAIKA